MSKDEQSNVLLPEEKRKSKKRRKTLINLVLEKLCQYTNIQVGAEQEGRKTLQGKMGALSQVQP